MNGNGVWEIGWGARVSNPIPVLIAGLIAGANAIGLADFIVGIVDSLTEDEVDPEDPTAPLEIWAATPYIWRASWIKGRAETHPTLAPLRKAGVKAAADRVLDYLRTRPTRAQAQGAVIALESMWVKETVRAAAEAMGAAINEAHKAKAKAEAAEAKTTKGGSVTPATPAGPADGGPGPLEASAAGAGASPLVVLAVVALGGLALLWGSR